MSRASTASPPRNTEPACEPDPARDEAAAWVVRLHEADASDRPALQAGCDAWLDRDPRHRRLFEQMQQMWSAFDPSRARRRRRSAGTLGLLLLGTLAAVAQLPWQVWTADHRTAPGEIRDVRLPDGSTVVLNSETAIDVDFDARRRIVHLQRGELMATVAHDAAGRPFTVRVDDGDATARGTRYSVGLDDTHTSVAVHESSVRLVPSNAADRAVTLNAGQRARLTPGGVSAPQPTRAKAPDWVDRQLVFRDVPLADAVERLKGYRPGLLMIGDVPARHDLHFTGVLPADDSDAALSLLADALSLEVRRVTPYLVWLNGRD